MSYTVTLLTSKAQRAVRRFSLAQVHEKSLQDTSWADGLRGSAAVFVVCSHLVLSLTRAFIAPCCGPDNQHPLLFQRPFLRATFSGPAWVALFFILSGFVNALKPIKLAKAGQIDAALSNLAVSTFRRSFRLFLPAATATVISWVVCQLGAYQTAKLSDSFWLSSTSPSPSSSLGTALDDLFRAIRTTWTYTPNNPYDQPQWALLYIFQGSMMVSVALLATVKLIPRYRVLALMGLSIWSCNWSIQLFDPYVGLNVFGGILLAEFSLSAYPATLSSFSLILTPPTAIVGMYLMSFPTDYADHAHWSNVLLENLWHYFPSSHDHARLCVSIGAQLFSFSIIISPQFRRLLSHPIPLWLGRVSFPIYLLHGTLLRTVFAWILFAGQSLVEKEEKGGQGEKYMVSSYPIPSIMLPNVLAILVFVVVLGFVVHYWTIKVEPCFGRMTQRAEEIVTGKSSEGKLVLPVRKE